MYCKWPVTCSFSHKISSPFPSHIHMRAQSVPYFFLFILLEAVVRALQHKPLPRINDSINSLSAGTILMLSQMCTTAIEIVAYSWVYGTFQLVKVPWDSVWTWLLTFLGVDFAYYWFHRMAHGEGKEGEGVREGGEGGHPSVFPAEVNLFWAAHQVHHSSEDYTLSTALRQSAVQRFNSWVSSLL